MQFFSIRTDEIYKWCIMIYGLLFLPNLAGAHYVMTSLKVC